MNYEMSDLIPIVNDLTEKFTCRESTSVSYETARRLMGAVIYCIRETEQGSENNSMLMMGENLKAGEVYKRGYELVLEKVTMSKKLFEEVAQEFESYGNYAYQDTVIRGMPAFFLHYDARFYPQNHILTLDYPILVPLEELCGADRIFQYLTCIHLEQKFLNRLPYDFIMDILASFHEEYEELLINVCSIVWRNIMGCMLIGRPLGAGRMRETDINKIKSIVGECSRQELEERFFHLTNILIQQEYEGSRELQNYLESDISNFVVELVHVVKYNCINHILF